MSCDLVVELCTTQVFFHCFLTPTDTEGQKIALFQYIAKNHKSVGITWSSIVDALRDIHAGDLSLRIREQYCSHRDGENVVH